jgi:hypothetical protein
VAGAHHVRSPRRAHDPEELWLSEDPQVFAKTAADQAS